MAPVQSKLYLYGTPVRATSASNQQPDGHTRSQSSLKEQLKLELRDAIFVVADKSTVDQSDSSESELSDIQAVDIVLDAFYAPASSLSKPLDRLDFHSTEVQRLIKACRTKGETKAYKPLANLFNHILDCLPGELVRYRFSVYDRQMQGRVDGSGNLKPDLLALSFLITGDTRVLWRQVRIAVEVKADFTEGFTQALTYARSMLAMEDKWFAPVLVVDHMGQQICGVIATRFGVFATRTLSLTEFDQFRAAARLIARLCTAFGIGPQGNGLAGYDPTRCMDRDGKLCISLPTATSGEAQWYKLDDISHRISLLGRATLVSFAKPVMQPEGNAASVPVTPSSPPDASEQMLAQEAAAEDASQRVPLPRRSDRLEVARSNVTAALRKARSAVDPEVILTSATARAAASALYPSSASRLSRVGSEFVDDGQVQPWAHYLSLRRGGAIPPIDVSPADELIVKSSWQAFPRHDDEAKALGKVQGLHGCPDYVGEVAVAHPLERVAELLLSGKLVVSKILDRSTPVEKNIGVVVQPRVHKMTIYKTPGVPLYHLVSKPKRLTHALADVLIGLYTSHRLDISHRDVTNGNLLGLAEAKARLDPEVKARVLALLGERFSREKFDGFLDHLHAFVNDFEHAIDWREAYREYSFARSGTPEFMSVQQLLVMVEARIRAHCVIDDFESCIWVALYNVLRAYVRKHSEAEKTFLASFATDDYGHLLGQKFRMLQLRAHDKEAKSALANTWELWSRLLPIANDAQARLAALMVTYLPSGAVNDAPPPTPSVTVQATQLPPVVQQASELEGFPHPPARPLSSRLDDPENPMFTRSEVAAAQKATLDEFHLELDALAEDVFYKYMKALQEAMPLLPDEDDEPDAFEEE